MSFSATMLQQFISRDLFQQNNERIKYVIPVVKPTKRKKTHFLAVVADNLNRNSYSLCLIKKNEQSEKYRKDKTWSFKDIKLIDGKSGNEENEFEILFSTEKSSYNWMTLNPNEKSSFLQTIVQIINQVPSYGDIKLLNTDLSISAMIQGDETSINEKLDDGSEWNPANDSYQALTSREEADLERLLELEVENTINNAEAFTEKLSRDLASMDSCNIQDIMASEQRVIDLMSVLQNAVDETFRLENRIIYYESLLKNVRDIVQKVEKKEAIVQIYNDNNNRLLDEVGQLVTKLELSSEHEYILAKCNLDSPTDLSRCFEAAQHLQESIQHEIPTALQSLKAVTEQRAYVLGVAQHFGVRFKTHLVKLFESLANDYRERFSVIVHEGVLAEHRHAHNRLLQFTPLMRWLREIELEMWSSAVTAYGNHFGEVYEKEFANFFEYLRNHCSHATVTTPKGNPADALLSPTPNEAKRKSLAVTDIRNDFRRNSFAESADSVSLRSSEISLSDWEEFDSYIDFMLKAVDPVYLSEQQFFNKFFELENCSNLSIPSTPVSQHKRGSALGEDISISNHSSSPSEHSIDANSKRSEKLCSILTKLFRSFENEFINFVNHYDGIHSLYFLVKVNNHVMSSPDTTSLLSKAYGNILIHIKRQFDRFMKAQQTEIAEAKDPKRPKVGTLNFIKNFETFAKQAETVVKYGKERRADIDRWYVQLMNEMFLAISRIAKEHQRVYKTPSQMIELENYHQLQILLPSLKIPCLENERKEAKIRYNNALKEYVNLYFRRPLEKLNIFFEGVQQKVQQGVKEDEIGYQLAYNKQELRKVIKDCNLKDIKRGLEEMYKRVEKHVSDPEGNLIQVIWRSMQEEFITQYKSIEEIIERCYPQANIKMSFSIGDVLNIFSEIAQTH